MRVSKRLLLIRTRFTRKSTNYFGIHESVRTRQKSKSNNIVVTSRKYRYRHHPVSYNTSELPKFSAEDFNANKRAIWFLTAQQRVSSSPPVCVPVFRRFLPWEKAGTREPLSKHGNIAKRFFFFFFCSSFLSISIFFFFHFVHVRGRRRSGRGRRAKVQRAAIKDDKRGNKK